MSNYIVQILLAYVSTPRHEGPEVNREMAENDAKVLYKAGEKKLGTDEKTFVQIFSQRSAAQVAAINHFYHANYGHSLKKVFYSNHFKFIPLTIVCLSLFINRHLSKLNSSGNKE